MKVLIVHYHPFELWQAPAWLLERLESFKRTFSERVRALDLGQDDEGPDDAEEIAG